MGRTKVTVDNLDKALNKILNNYRDLLWENIDEATEKVAKRTRTAVANSSNVFNQAGHWGKSKYSRGWRVKKIPELWYNTYVIHQAAKPYETHLLEYGHELDGVYNGQRMTGRTQAFPHIAPAAEKVPDKLQKEVVDAVHRSS